MGSLHVGLGPVAFVERVMWGKRLIYANLPALREGQRRRAADV
jgi:hypothetical protein